MNRPTYVLDEQGLAWALISVGVLVGISLVVVAIFYFGRKIAGGMSLHDRGSWDRPLPEPFDKDTVIARYVRRRWYPHKHHRRHHRRKA